MSESDDIANIDVAAAGSVGMGMNVNVGSDEAVGPNEAQDGKKQMNPRSEIWNHYTRLPNDRNKAKCKYCS